MAIVAMTFGSCPFDISLSDLVLVSITTTTHTAVETMDPSLDSGIGCVAQTSSTRNT